MSSNSTDQLTYDVSELDVESFFGYWPSLALACTALALFTVAGLVVGTITELTKRYRFTHAMTVTGLLEAAGYAAMIYCIQRSGKSDIFTAYVVNQVFIILSPNVIQGTLYWTLGLILKGCPELRQGRKWLRGGRVTAVFVSYDLAAVTVQAIGISIWASSQSSGTPDSDKIRLGCCITLVGLFIQLTGEAVFAWLTIWTHRHAKNSLIAEPNTRKLYVGIYLVMGWLAVRNIYRFVEFLQATILTWPPSDDAYVLSHKEVLFYTLDTIPILLCFVSFIAFHFARLLPPPEQLAAASQTALKAGEGEEQSGPREEEPAQVKGELV